EIYNPATNTWTSITNFPLSSFGDDPSQLLPDGRVLCGFISDSRTFIYDPVANTWTQTGSKRNGDRSDEETWLKLPDDSILSYDVFSSTPGHGHAQRYIPASGTWVSTGDLPDELSSAAV